MAKPKIDKTEQKGKTLPTKELLEAIQTIALSCYGVKSLDRKELDSQYLKKSPKLQDCIEIRKSIDGSYRIRLYVVLSFGIKATEVLSEVQKRILYELGRAGLKVETVDVYAQRIDNGK